MQEGFFDKLTRAEYFRTGETVEKVACQLIEIDKPLFRVGRTKFQARFLAKLSPKIS